MVIPSHSSLFFHCASCGRLISIIVLICSRLLNAHPLEMVFNISSDSKLGCGQNVANKIARLEKCLHIRGCPLPSLWILTWPAWTSQLDGQRHVVQLPYDPRLQPANLAHMACSHLTPSSPQKAPPGCWPLIYKGDQLSLAGSSGSTQTKLPIFRIRDKAKYWFKSLSFRTGVYAARQN